MNFYGLKATAVKGTERSKTLGTNVVDLLKYLRLLPDKLEIRATYVLSSHNIWVSRTVTYAKATGFRAKKRTQGNEDDSINKDEDDLLDKVLRKLKLYYPDYFGIV